ncbi:hypothetical protein Slin_3161 [Spirosoma linguale DSM 74]|uniref:Uncharacterized protein n=1 Tax=Spirosoma linguale (strain ATCC 33905 / DSM 74 / LMG 10896 / Claus 1) TaxID=504472 RepID=D2QMA9_SPILD|nr:hypothetical protein Slin_3161 [Spirosoma linguale DSM 74]
MSIESFKWQTPIKPGSKFYSEYNAAKEGKMPKKKHNFNF